MPNKRLNDNEINALLQAFDEFNANNAASLKQSRTFKVLLISLNIYFLIFVLLYVLSVNDLINTPGQVFNTYGLRTTLGGRSNMIFWILVFVNISAYYNIGFKTVCLAMFIYSLNTVVDNFVLLSSILSFQQRPYVTSFVLSLPLATAGIAWMGIAFKSRAEEEEI